MRLLDHKFGRFDRRRPVGPRRMPHYDLLWFHEGGARLQIGGAAPIELSAPNGVLIAPDTPFRGAAVTPARASICHFLPEPGDGIAIAPMAAGFRLCDPGLRIETQAAIRYALRLAERHPDAHERRVRLLCVLLDSFTGPQPAADPLDPAIEAAWAWACDHIGTIRSIADVAAFSGLSESRFRARHSRVSDKTAGSRLRTLRLEAAERLLASTDKTLAEIAGLVGYGHAETLAAAFNASFAMPPGRYRRLQRI